MIIPIDEFLAETESFFQSRNGGFFVPLLRIDIFGFDAELIEITGNFGRTVVTRQYNQRVFQPELAVDINKQVSQGAVKTQQIVFHFEARRTEDMSDVVGGGKADG